MLKEIILCKYGEIVLKGANRYTFESMLTKEVRKRMNAYGKFKVYHAQSTIYIEPIDDVSDIDGAYECAKKIFGIIGVGRAAVAEKNMGSITKTAGEYLADKLSGIKSFRVDAKRSDKTFPVKSPQIAAEVGGAILARVPGIQVDLHSPQAMIKVEVRETNAYIHANQEKGAGGLPIRSSGKGLLLLSGGIDSPVAGYMMAKRGLDIEALHFESFPYTSDRAKEKVLTLAEELCEYTSKINVHIISLTHIQEELRDKCEEDYFTLLLRIFMMKLAQRCAEKYNCSALITGESLGQVASQTIGAISLTDSVVNMPVFRPCIGMDKEEIVSVARHIGTFETSILPYEDCCTVFTPKHPKTRPQINVAMQELKKIDFDALMDEAYSSMYTETRLIHEGYRY
ncbi:MAG: tRNA uracil 4-sulfurtransferase ThiI [Eubacteriales bacterium]|nr:tRNA uracil 4-sulfurtransferase ThiI [Eubacteriales bacterium]